MCFGIILLPMLVIIMYYGIALNYTMMMWRGILVTNLPDLDGPSKDSRLLLREDGRGLKEFNRRKSSEILGIPFKQWEGLRDRKDMLPILSEVQSQA